MPRIPLKDQETILMVAEGYLAEEENWIRGKWKCPATGPTEDGRGYEHKTDDNGQPLYQYCIQGAINQATYDVLGEERAISLGAVVFNKATNSLDFRGRPESVNPTRSLGLNRIATKLFGPHIEEAMQYNDHPQSTHDGVLSILRTRLKEVRTRMQRDQTIKKRSSS